MTSKLNVIAEQIKSLQDQAHEILKQAQHDQVLHRASCQCKRIIGHTYYLYAKGNEQLYFSMLSPEDWHGEPPHQFMGSYRLEQDMSWTAMDEQDAVDKPHWSELIKLPG